MVKLDRVVERVGAHLAWGELTGDGTPVVFTHGAGMDHTMFVAQAEAVQDAGHRVIVWDMRAHGESAIDEGVRFTASDALGDLTALLDAAGVERALLVGHSLGGNLSQEFVRRQPERAAGLVVVDSTWNAGPLTALESFGLRIAAPTLALIPALRLPGLMARASAVRPEVIHETERVFAQLPKSVFLDVWRATASFVKPDADYRTPVPLGLIRGAEDRTGNIATAMPAWAATEGVAEHMIPDAGHVVTLDAPDATNRALLSILAEMAA